jgi:hypothetical protein
MVDAHEDAMMHSEASLHVGKSLWINPESKAVIENERQNEACNLTPFL